MKKLHIFVLLTGLLLGGILSYGLAIQAAPPRVFEVWQGGTGFSSSSPNAILTIGRTASSTLIATSSQPFYIGSLNATTSATSTFTGGLVANILTATSTTATSTFYNGLQLINGCFKESTGQCISVENLISLSGSSAITGALTSNNASDLGTSGSRWGTVYSNTVNTTSLTFTIATPSNANFGSNISVNGGTINLGASPNTATTTLVANGSGQLTLSAAGTNQNVILTPSGTGSVVISTLGVGALSSSVSGTISSGTLSVGNGGTGAITFTSNGVLYGNGTSAIQVTSQGAANSILTANAGAPSFSASPTIGTSITVPTLIGGTAVSSTLALRSTSGVGSSDAILFQVGNNGATEAARITTSGNVGIGTTGPGAKLDVSGGDLWVRSPGILFTNRIRPYDSGNVVLVDGGGNLGIGTTSPSQVLSVAGSIYMTGGINPAGGNVGIGVASPTQLLDVVTGGSGTGVNLIGFRTTADGGKGGLLGIDTTNRELYFRRNDAGDYGWQFQNASGGALVTINTSGNVGIGTTSPGTLFAVQGRMITNSSVAFGALAAFASGDSAVCQRGSGEITVDSGVSSCIVSRRDMKHDILTISVKDAIQRILRLNPVSFAYNGINKSDIGLIAEDVADIDKRYAQYNQKGEPQAINWTAITADLIKTVQQQQQEIEGLKEEIKKLKQ